MTDRVKQLRDRLAPLLPLVAAPLRDDLEALLELAELGQAARDAMPSAAAQPRSDEPSEVSHVAAWSGARREGDAGASIDEHASRSLRRVLAEILAANGASMRVRDLTQAALDRGWRTASSSPRNVVAACLNGKEEFVQLGRGEYALRSPNGQQHAGAPALESGSPEPSATASSDADAPIRDTAIGKPPALRALLRQILAERGAPMRAAEIVDVLVARGWTTTSPRPRDVVSAVLTAKPDFVAVARGIYSLRDATGAPSGAPESRPAASGPVLEPQPASSTAVPDAADESAPAALTGAADVAIDVPTADVVPEPAAPRDPYPYRPSDRAIAGLPPGVLRRAAPSELDAPAPARTTSRAHPPVAAAYSPAVAEIGRELDFLLRHVADARADTAVLAPALLRLQITAWIARARALNDRARNHPEIVRATGRVAAELGDLCKRWWPGSVEAMKLDTQPYHALQPFAHEPLDRSLAWIAVADRLDARMEAAWAEPDFDDGWRDTRWLCDDERFVGDRLAEAESLLTRLGTPPHEPPLKRAIDLHLASGDVHELVVAARGVRWVRGVVTDGLRWGLLMGRLRWIAATHPVAARTPLPQLLAAEYQPLGSGWGFDELRRRDGKELLLRELPQLSQLELPRWLTRAIDVFDNPELARVLAGRIPEVAAIDPNALGSRRARGRVRKLAAMMGVRIAEIANGPSAPAGDVEPESPNTEVLGDGFSSIRTSLLGRIGGNRALFISNREDAQLRDRLSTAFGLEIEWCVASPRRTDAAADAIRRGRYDVVLSATGFQDHSMDIAFSRAAKEASTMYVRVNRGRPAAWARAIARELGLEAVS